MNLPIKEYSYSSKLKFWAFKFKWIAEAFFSKKAAVTIFNEKTKTFENQHFNIEISEAYHNAKNSFDQLSVEYNLQKVVQSRLKKIFQGDDSI